MNLEPGTKFKVIDSFDGRFDPHEIFTFLGRSHDALIFSESLSTQLLQIPEVMASRAFQEIPVTDYKDLLQANVSLTNMINYAMHIFPKAFINHNDELIFVPKHNIYFQLRGCNTALDFKSKMFAWLSRPISKGLNRKPASKLLLRFNRLMNTQFTMEDMDLIYTRLGNDCNLPLCIAFIESGYDMELLAYEKEISL